MTSQVPIISCIGFQLDTERVFPINLNQELHIGFSFWIGNNRSRKGKWRSAGHWLCDTPGGNSPCPLCMWFNIGLYLCKPSADGELAPPFFAKAHFYRNSKSRLNGLLPSYRVRPASLVRAIQFIRCPGFEYSPWAVTEHVSQSVSQLVSLSMGIGFNLCVRYNSILWTQI